MPVTSASFCGMASRKSTLAQPRTLAALHRLIQKAILALPDILLRAIRKRRLYGGPPWNERLVRPLSRETGLSRSTLRSCNGQASTGFFNWEMIIC